MHSQHTASISWQRNGPGFLEGRYSREHTWTFDGGITVPASPALSSVPLPYSNPAAVDPEEAFVAAVASCHMLTFLFLASRQGFQVDSYLDHPVGTMTPNEQGVPWVSSIVLQPELKFSGNTLPSRTQQDELHHLAHQQCYIANSIKTRVSVEYAPPQP